VRLGAGELTAFAGRHVLGGQYLVGDGDGRLRADGDIGELASNRRLDSALLATGGGSWRVGASACWCSMPIWVWPTSTWC
jgi:hypothetical protein